MTETPLPQVDLIRGVRAWSYDLDRFGWDGLAQALAALTRADAPALAGLPPPAIHDDDLSMVCSVIEAFRRRPGEMARFDYRIVEADGAVLGQSAVMTCRLNAAGEPDLVIGRCRQTGWDSLGPAAFYLQQLRLKPLMDAGADGVVVSDISGAIKHASPEAASLLGFAVKDVVARAGPAFILPDDRRAVEKAYRLAWRAQGAEPVRVECRVRARSGAEIEVELRPTLVRDRASGQPIGFSTVLHDITAAKQAEATHLAALATEAAATRFAQLAEILYRGVVENTRDVILQYGPDRVITYASPSCRELLYAAEDLVGKDVRDLLHPDDVDRVSAAFATYYAEGVEPSLVDRTFRLRRKDGGYVWLEVSSAAIRDRDGALECVVNTYRDVSERLALEARLTEARVQAEAAVQAKAAFLANMSHELRTPLTSVIGYSQLIQAAPDLPESIRRAADRISVGGKSLLAVINDVLDFSKIEAGEMKIECAPAPLDPLFRDVAELMRQQAALKGVALVVRGLESLPPFVETDPDRVRQVLLNLVGNAVKFSERGKVEVAVRYTEPGRWLEVDVTDQGPGMTEDQLSRLFERFQQADGSLTRRQGGTGLGLAICKGLIEAMGGEIGARSRPGSGSTFWFRLPAPLCAASRDQDEAAASPSLAGVRVLAVDDNAECREVVSAILKSVDVEVTLARSGAEGIEAANQSMFDVILMDLHMEGLDGVATTRQIRDGGGANRFTPILICSADGAGLASDFGALFDGLIVKPFAPANLLGGVVAALDVDMVGEAMRAG